VPSPNPIQKRLLDCYPRLVLFARKRSTSETDADDLAQAAMVLALYGGPRGGQTWDGEGDPFLFLCGVVKNELQSRRRSQRRGTTDAGPTTDEPPPSSTNPERIILQREKNAEEDALRAALDVAIEADDECRRLLALFDEGVTAEQQQAARLGVPLGAIKSARKRLKRAADKARAMESKTLETAS
jgi:RNA polymerase sigma factor (sigma-70 family)